MLININQFDPTTLNKRERETYYSYVCPISNAICCDPIMVSTKQIYDRQSLVDYFEYHDNPPSLPCPLTRLPIQIEELTSAENSNEEMKGSIIQFVNRQEAKVQILRQITQRFGMFLSTKLSNNQKIEVIEHAHSSASSLTFGNADSKK